MRNSLRRTWLFNGLLCAVTTSRTGAAFVSTGSSTTGWHSPPSTLELQQLDFLRGSPVPSCPKRPLAVLQASIAPPEHASMVDMADSMLSSPSFQLTIDETNPLIRLGQGDNEKIINAFGLWCAIVSLVTGPIWMAAMMLVDQMQHGKEWDPNRAIYDTTGKVWAKVWLTLSDSFPTISGEPLVTGRPCLYVANHASWLDIPVLCTVLDPVFKFIAKGELSKVPCIGQQLRGVSFVFSFLFLFADAFATVKQRS